MEMGPVAGGAAGRGAAGCVVWVADKTHARIFDCASRAGVWAAGGSERIFGGDFADPATGYGRNYNWRRPVFWKRIFPACRNDAGKSAVDGIASGAIHVRNDVADAAKPDSGEERGRTVESGRLVASLIGEIRKPHSE